VVSGKGETSTPGSRSRSPGAFCTENITWNTGLWPGCRGGANRSTTTSNGTSWWANAPNMVSRTRPNTSANDGSPVRSVRITTVLARHPTRDSSSTRPRPATGTPTTTSA